MRTKPLHRVSVLNRTCRRTFLAQASGLGFASLLSAALPRSAWPNALRAPLGIQLWSVKDALRSDPAATLKQLRTIGYRYVETAGFGSLTASGLRRLLDDAGLVCPSAHLDFRNGKAEVLFEDAHALGARYVVSSVLRPGTGELPVLSPSMKPFERFARALTLDDARRTAELANQIGRKARQAGLQFTYHNHFFEFIDQGNGAVAYDVLLQETDAELVEFEIDCGWMIVAGRSPQDYIKRHPQRFPLIHVKEFLPVNGTDPQSNSPGLRVGTELGHGVIDYRPILARAAAAGLKYCFAEQEEPFSRMTPLEAAKVNFDYLSAIDK